MRRKSRIAGVWLNRDRSAFRRVPVLRRGEHRAAGRDRRAARCSRSWRSAPPSSTWSRSTPAARLSEIASLRDALVRRKQEQGLYSRKPAPINFIGEELFRTNLVFPANVPPGIYQVQVFELQDGFAGDAQRSTLVVSKVGFEADIYDFAQHRAALRPGGDRARHRRRVAGRRGLSTRVNMSEQAAPAAPDASPSGGELRERIFLVVVDETEEMKAALRFACRRALHTGGRVALFYAIEPPEFQHWQGVERVMQEEAASTPRRCCRNWQPRSRPTPARCRSSTCARGAGATSLALIAEEPGISLLVLGMASGREGPGPLVSYLVSQGMPIRLPSPWCRARSARPRSTR